MQRESLGGRLIGIDALRGIAALGVVLYHTVGPNFLLTQGWGNLVGSPIQILFSYGYAGVFLFFVISGFCIHLQWARAKAAGKDHKINFRAFWKRRLRRLYPPYLFALALYLIVAASTSGIDITHFFVYDMVMHLLMLHNLDPHTCYSINGVFWTLAIEEQLYLAYFLLLFIRIRWGWMKALLVCAAARIGWFLLSYFAYRAYRIGVPVPEAAASHWLTWALGAIAVEAAVGLIKLPSWTRNIWVGVASLLIAIGLSHGLPIIDQEGIIHHLGWFILHPAWGFAFFVLVNWIVAAEARWRESGRMPDMIVRMAWVGVFSYSLYLTHQLVIMVSWRFVIDGWPQVMNSLLVVAPLAIAFAFIFFMFFELPYMKPAVKKEALAPGAVTPAQDTASA
jgi:peptidoglycan/LPS O-acetylase OafA/YrhL